jgi:nicotinamidase-related amidase
MSRVWDKFLTERDKQHLIASGWGQRAPFGFGTTPAVVVVDDYYGALGTCREPILESVKTWPASCGIEGWTAIDRTTEFLDVARAAGAPIVYLHGMEGWPNPWTGRGERASPLAHLPAELRAKANQIVDEVAPQPGDLVLQKVAASGFAGTPLQFHLNYLGIDTVLVVGETTSGCVRATVVDGVTQRYRMGVVEECCFDRTEAAHAINLFDMDHKYADVVDLEAAKRYLLTGSTVAVTNEAATVSV